MHVKDFATNAAAVAASTAVAAVDVNSSQTSEQDERDCERIPPPAMHLSLQHIHMCVQVCASVCVSKWRKHPLNDTHVAFALT